MADLKLDPVAHKVLKGGKEISTYSYGIQTLGIASQECRSVVSRLDIEEFVWDKKL